MSEPNAKSTPDRVRTTLARTADDMTLDATTPDAAMRRGDRRRRRRRGLLAGGVAAMAVIVVGTVVGTRDRGDDTIELSTPDTTEPTEPTTTAPTTAEPTAEPTTEPTTPATTVPITTPPTLPPASPADSTSVVGSGPDPDGEVTQLLPWRDGFLSISVEYAPQPLTPLSDEMAALFPDEVVALFPDGLPPTIGEATEILSEAGLLDEVTEVLAAHPDVSDAIYAVEPPPPVITAAFTVDGIGWKSIELSSPTEYPGQFAVSDGRLITWAAEPNEPFSGDVAPGERRLVVASTTDLTTWQTATIELVAPGAGTGTEHLQMDVFVNSFAVADDRWVAQVAQHTWIDYETLLPDDLRAELVGSERGYSIGETDGGIEVITTNDDGTTERKYEFSWNDLGLDDDPLAGRGFADSEPPTMLTGTFDGTSEEMATPSGAGFATVASLGDEFVLLGQDVQVSPDGRTWTALDGLPADGHWHSASVVTGGVLLVGEGPDGPFAWLRSDDGSVTQAELPDLPERYGLWNQSGTAAWITEIGEPPQPDWDPLEIVVEHDGFVLTMIDGPDGTGYTLTDAATGDVVRAETVRAAEDQIWDFDETTGEAMVVVRDEFGDEIIRIPGTIVDRAIQEAIEESPPATTVGAGPVDEWRPDLWLLATADGREWLSVDVPDPDPESGYWPHAAAVNGDSVLYLTADGWMLESLPT